MCILVIRPFAQTESDIIKRLGVLILFLLIAVIGKAQTLTINTPATNPASYTLGTSTLSVSADAFAAFGDVVTNVIYTLPPLTQVTGTPGSFGSYTGNFNISTLAVGTYTLTGTLNTKGSISGTARTPIVKTVTINIAPAAPTAPATSTCIGSTATINVSGGSPAGGTYNLYAVATGGTALLTTTGSTFTTPVITATTTYYVSYIVNGIESTRQAVIVTANSLPAAVNFTAAPATVAVGANTTVTLTSTVIAGITYTWDTDGGTPATKTGTTAFTVNWATAGAKVITLTATNASGCATTATQTVIVTKTIASGNYAYSHPITLTLPSGTITGTLTNFPALVYIKEDALKAGLGCANNVSSTSGGVNGYDFAFTTDVGTNELFYQVESFDQTTGTLLVWVQVPALGITTNLKFYFGSLAPAHTASFAKATWSGDYQAVYHFNEGSATASVLDATSNNKNAIQTSTTVATGQINNAYQFNGTSSKIISNSTANNITGSFTLSAWVQPATYTLSSSGGYDYKLITNEALNYTTAGYKLGLYGSTPTTVYPEMETRPNTGEPVSTTRSTSTTQTAVTPNGWHYVQGVYNSATGTFYTYLDGRQNFTKTGATVSGTTGQNIYLGSDFGAGNFLNGIMDEVRISNTPKSADWIKAEYYNQNNPFTFTTSSSTITAVPANVAAIGGSLAYTWTGAAPGIAATNPANAANWTSPAAGSPAVAPPIDGTVSIVIPSGLTKYPVLTANAAFYGITIEPGANIDLNGKKLTVGCNVYNSGRINAAGATNASTIEWKGISTPQLYTGTNTANTAQFGDFIVNNTASSGQVKITGGPVDLYNTLTLTAGSLNIDNAGNGALTLKSSATQTAKVAQITAGTITGNVNAERFISGGSLNYRGYRLISSPVYSATVNGNKVFSVNYLKNSSYLTGTTDVGANGFDKAGNPTLYLFREDKVPLTTSFTNGSYRGINTISTSPNYNFNIDGGPFNIPVGNGVEFFYRGDRSAGTLAAQTITTYVPTSVVTTTSGILNTGQIIVKNWYTPASSYLGYTTTTTAVRGYNLVGNPYASTIDWETFNTTSATTGIYGVNIGNTIYELNPRTKNFNTYQKGGSYTNDATRYIVSGQGFFVVANAANPQLIFNESAKSTAQNTFNSTLLMADKTAIGNIALSSTEPERYLRLQLAKDTVNKDDIYIGFKSDATTKYLFNEDAAYRPGIGVLSLSSRSDDKVLLSINKLPLPKQSQRIRLYLTATNNGLYQLNLTEMKNIPDAFDVWLMDTYKKDSLNIRLHKTYNFNIIKADTATYNSSRFSLIIRQNPALALRLLDFTGIKVTDGAQLTWITENESNYTNFTVEKSTDGGKSFEVIGGLLSNGDGKYTLIDKGPITGLNQYRLKQDDINGTISYSNIVNLTYANKADATVNETLTVFPNPVVSTINVAIVAPTNAVSYTIKIANSNGTIVKTAVSTDPNWQDNVSNLIPGNYFIQVINNDKKVVVGNAKFTKH